MPLRCFTEWTERIDVLLSGNALCRTAPPTSGRTAPPLGSRSIAVSDLFCDFVVKEFELLFSMIVKGLF